MESASTKIFNELGQEALDGVEKFGAFNEGWQHAVWGRFADGSKLPMSAAAPCCGFQCETCEENPESKFWCRDPILVRPCALSPATGTVPGCRGLLFAWYNAVLTHAWAHPANSPQGKDHPSDKRTCSCASEK